MWRLPRNIQSFLIWLKAWIWNISPCSPTFLPLLTHWIYKNTVQIYLKHNHVILCWKSSGCVIKERGPFLILMWSLRINLPISDGCNSSASRTNTASSATLRRLSDFTTEQDLLMPNMLTAKSDVWSYYIQSYHIWLLFSKYHSQQQHTCLHTK